MLRYSRECVLKRLLEVDSVAQDQYIQDASLDFPGCCYRGAPELELTAGGSSEETMPGTCCSLLQSSEEHRKPAQASPCWLAYLGARHCCGMWQVMYATQAEPDCNFGAVFGRYVLISEPPSVIWTPDIHKIFPTSFKEAVVSLLLCHQSLTNNPDVARCQSRAQQLQQSSHILCNL